MADKIRGRGFDLVIGGKRKKKSTAEDVDRVARQVIAAAMTSISEHVEQDTLSASGNDYSTGVRLDMAAASAGIIGALSAIAIRSGITPDELADVIRSTYMRLEMLPEHVDRLVVGGSEIAAQWLRDKQGAS